MHPGVEGTLSKLPLVCVVFTSSLPSAIFFFYYYFFKILMYSRKPSKIEIFMIQISSENHLKYLGCGHVSAQNYSISIKFICLGVYIEVIKSV